MYIKSYTNIQCRDKSMSACVRMLVGLPGLNLNQSG
jgi:hypothetical protein